MLGNSKQKREGIMAQLSKNQKRLSSQDRRKKVEKQLNDYVQTQNYFYPRSSRISSISESPNHKTAQNFMKPDHNKESQSNNILQSFTPSVKDIQSSPKKGQLLKILTQQELKSEFYQKSNEKLPLIKEQQITPRQPKNTIIDDLHLDKSVENVSSKGMVSQVQDEQIKLPNKPLITQSQGSNNNSDAIFFTSQFKEFINKQNDSPPKENDQNLKQKDIGQEKVNSASKKEQTQKKMQSGHPSIENPQPISPNLSKNIAHNASGKSLSLSNQSSLKYSLNDSAVHDFVTRKVHTEALSELSARQDTIQKVSINQFAEILLAKENIKEWVIFFKEFKLKLFLQRYSKVIFIRELEFKKQLKFELKKNQIKAEKFQKKMAEQRFMLMFNKWKQMSLQSKQKVDNFINEKERQTKNKIIRSFKILVYDKRINNQVDMFFLSKKFQILKNAIDKTKRSSNQKALKHYFFSLKRKLLRSLAIACTIVRKQKQQNQLADENYYFYFLRKVFLSWKEILPQQQRYIKLSMTTKNFYKETQDHKLLQTRTIDFKQTK